MLLGGGAALYAAWLATRPAESDLALPVAFDVGAVGFAAPALETASAVDALELERAPGLEGGEMIEAQLEPAASSEAPGAGEASTSAGVAEGPTLPGTTDGTTPKARITIQVYGTDRPPPRRSGGGSKPKGNRPPGSGNSEPSR